MSEYSELKADKARQLSLPARHLFRLLLPLPILVCVGFVGSRQGWIGNKGPRANAGTDVVLTVPDAKVKELEKDKKYSSTLSGQSLTAVNGVGLSLDENSNINSRMLSGDPASAVGIEANSLRATEQLAQEMGVTNQPATPSTYKAMQVSSQQRKNQIRQQQARQQHHLNRQVHTTIQGLYQQPGVTPEEKAERNRAEREEEQRLRANEKLLALLDRQVQQQQPLAGPQQERAPVLTRSRASSGSGSDIYEIHPYQRVIGTSSQESSNAFYGLNGRREKSSRPSKTGHSIRAVVHGDGEGITVTNGTSIALRMQEETLISVGGEPLVLPAHTLVYGQTHLSGDRIDITVTSIRLDNYIYPVQLAAYDLDGRKGLYVPDMKVKQQTLATLTQGSSQLASPGYIMGGSVGQQVGGQLASQGLNVALNAGKNLINRKAQQPKAQIRPNHQVLLRSASGSSFPDYREEVQE
ncbi:conjugative transposon protein TraM [Telluribacter humicola]|uniref:conjugative transposon protein TraM n=1 Tax=Telluribacter humicola TaxID=1720261 RepID=UPI001A978E14|nr:conjugative transposon protein TraM [Telluribacter humicola]